MNARQLLKDCAQNSTPLDVLNVSGSAADNAVDTIGAQNRFDTNGDFTEQFIDLWYASVQSILCESGGCTQAARDWFDTAGVTY